MKYNLLRIVQLILTSLDSDTVNTIDETEESSAVADIVEMVYNELKSEEDPPENFQIYQLLASGNTSIPTIMSMPSAAVNLVWLKYDKKELGDTYANWENVSFVKPQEFLEFVSALNPSETEIFNYTYTGDGYSYQLAGYNDRAPTRYTTFDDSTLLFDAYDSAVDMTLQQSKTMAYGQLDSTFTRSDTYIPDLDHRMFARLINEVRAQAYVDLKQANNNNAERKARRFQVKNQKDRNRIYDEANSKIRRKTYGRK